MQAGCLLFFWRGLADMFTVISVSPPAAPDPPHSPKCADAAALMGLEKVTYGSPVVSGSPAAPPFPKNVNKGARCVPACRGTHAQPPLRPMSSTPVTCVCIELISTVVHFPHGKAQ